MRQISFLFLLVNLSFFMSFPPSNNFSPFTGFIHSPSILPLSFLYKVGHFPSQFLSGVIPHQSPSFTIMLIQDFSLVPFFSDIFSFVAHPARSDMHKRTKQIGFSIFIFFFLGGDFVVKKKNFKKGGGGGGGLERPISSTTPSVLSITPHIFFSTSSSVNLITLNPPLSRSLVFLLSFSSVSPSWCVIPSTSITSFNSLQRKSAIYRSTGLCLLN